MGVLILSSIDLEGQGVHLLYITAQSYNLRHGMFSDGQYTVT
jgi:hypothetical protein